MSDQLEIFEQITSSPNFLLILVGGAIWYIGYLVQIIGIFIQAAGFGLTIIASAEAAMNRTVSSVLPGLLIGGLIYIIGYYLLYAALVGWIIGPMFTVAGGVMLLFYGFSIALHRIDIPIVKNLEDFLESKQKKAESKSEPKVKTTGKASEDEEDEEEKDRTEQ
ncbi:MAG: hypothetical protein ACFFCP_11460 [Promethearchaeota archaeon]